MSDSWLSFLSGLSALRAFLRHASEQYRASTRAVGAITLVHPEAFREAAFKERRKIHDIVMEGIRGALKKRGYSVTDDTKPAKKR